MKKRIGITIIVILILVCIWFICSGYFYQSSAYISDFYVSENGEEMTFSVEVGSSIGYIRGYKDDGGGAKPHYLKFYSAWGGFNSSIGAKSEYTLKLGPDDTEIFVYHGDGGYTLTLQKNVETGQWHRVK